MKITLGQMNLLFCMKLKGIVNLTSLDDKNEFLVVYAKLWTQLTLTHSLNARARSVL
jgi:hypothetical protein